MGEKEIGEKMKWTERMMGRREKRRKMRDEEESQTQRCKMFSPL